MNIRVLGAALLGSAAVIATPAQASQSWRFHADHVLGTSLDMVVVAAEEKIAGFAVDVAQREIARLDAILSGWRSDSELSALNAASVFTASPDLFAVIAACEDWRAKTAGAFSARLGQLENMLADGVQSAMAPLASAINNAKIILDAATGQIARPQQVTFAVDGLAKGYIIDRALEAARSLPGVRGLMLDVGGDLRVWGEAPSAAGWRIGVVNTAFAADNAAAPITVKLSDKAIATSGVGTRAQTIFNPQNGVPVSNIILATAIADRAADADALASAFSVLPPAESVALADRLPGTAAHIVAADGTVYTSTRFDKMVVAQNTPAKPAAPAKGAAWPAGYSVQIEYELLAPFGGRRVRNPYVVIWITNEAGDLVRTLTYQADKYRYMRENYVFWNKYGAQMDLDSVTRPTRPPGRYTIEWDGKDDAGHAVPQGNYTINIEGAREHGFHSVQRIDLTLGTGETDGEAAKLEDMGPVKAHYGKAP